MSPTPTFASSRFSRPRFPGFPPDQEFGGGHQPFLVRGETLRRRSDGTPPLKRSKWPASLYRSLGGTDSRCGRVETRWLCVDEIVGCLGVSKEAVDMWLCGAMPGHDVGHFWKFKWKEIDAWGRTAGSGATLKRHDD
jgi:hypothetical protein